MTKFATVNEMLNIFSRPLAVHAVLCHITGSLNAGAFLSQALYWTPRTNYKDGWFYKTQQEWFDELYLSRREQETVRKQLIKLKFMNEHLYGVPAKLWFRVDLVQVKKAIDALSDDTTSMAESAKLDSTNPPYLDGGKRQTLSLSENSTENSREVTQPAPLEQLNIEEQVKILATSKTIPVLGEHERPLGEAGQYLPKPTSERRAKKEHYRSPAQVEREAAKRDAPREFKTFDQMRAERTAAAIEEDRQRDELLAKKEKT